MIPIFSTAGFARICFLFGGGLVAIQIIKNQLTTI